MQKKPINIVIAGIVLLTITGCSSAATSTPAAISRQVPVQRGDLVVSVSVDGNLEMTDYYNLAFSASNDPTASSEVNHVLVEEGEQVKRGQLLAYLDDTTQRLAVKSANNAVQTSLSTLYETVPRLPQFPGVYYKKYDIPLTFVPDKIIYDKSDPPKPIMASEAGVHDNPVYMMYYPNATILSSYGWAQEEVARAHELFQTDNYSAAASELYVASADLEACIKILEDTINNPESGLGNTAPFVNDSNYVAFSIQNDNSFAAYYIQELRAEVASLRQAQADIENVYKLINQAKYGEAKPMLSVALTTVDETAREVIENVNRLKLRDDTTIYGREISLHFYNAATERLDAAITGIGKGGLFSSEMNDNLRVARHYMELCNGILGSNDMVLQHGLSLKAEQNAKIDLASKLVDQDSKRNNFLSTFLWSPIDGTVVSVSLKEKDVLSSKNNTAKTIVVVNTNYIEFWGSVDEIDIMKIKVGQKATVLVDAVPDKKFNGVVSFISTKGTPDSNKVVKYSVRIKLEPTDVELKGKLTATADIGIATIENALLIPLSAVTTTGATSTVAVVSGDKGGTEKRTVTLGTQNQQYVQVIEGLSDSDTVMVVDKASGAPVSTTMGPPGGGPPPGGGGPPPGR